MSETLINLIIRIVVGALGGHVRAMPWSVGQHDSGRDRWRGGGQMPFPP